MGYNFIPVMVVIVFLKIGWNWKLSSLFFQVPQLFVSGKYIGGEKEICELHESGDLKKTLIEADVL